MKQFLFYYWIERNDESQDREIVIQGKDIKNAIDIFFNIYPLAKLIRIDTL
jgi:hypothetical protein